jgi:phasin family protein
VNLQLEAAKDVLAEGTTGVRALAAAKAPSDVVEMHQRFVKPNVAKAQTYAVELYGVASNIRREMDKLVSSQRRRGTSQLVGPRM